jgi:hypothetical protein
MIPGVTESSGYTQRLIDNANRCDQERILARLQGLSACSVPKFNGRLNVQSSSRLETKKQDSCKLSPAAAILLPKASVPEGIRIQNLINSLNTCNPATGSQINRTLFRYPGPVITVCPPPTAEELNSTQPSAPLIGCQPSRFF